MAAASRDRAIVFASLVAITAVAWLYVLKLAHDMAGMDNMPNMPNMAMETGAGSFVLTAVMWIVMMIGMMLPSATPMILLFTMVQRKQGTHPARSIGAFIAGYLLVWGGFSLLAAALQTVLVEMALLSPLLTPVSKWTAGAAFLLAGVYEFSAIKNRCLTLCVNPLRFVTSYWRPGVSGALRMGIVHGAFCLGCCWVLMLLLFAVGVMNLIWVALLAALVLLQKVLPHGRLTTSVTGGAMLLAGVALMLA